MNNRMNRTARNWLILVALIAVAVLATLWATSTTGLLRPPSEPREPPTTEIHYDIELFYTVETVVSTINAALSILLLIIYAGIYQKTQSEFTLGLTIFSAVLFLHALFSIPLIFRAFGFYPIGLGPFAMLPDLFTFAALTVLLYLSAKY